uniref:Uncharacterized protein n=1 Tax=Arundo donax TaxID=35708 RepID=A0A0A9DXE5_ARUDO
MCSATNITPSRDNKNKKRIMYMNSSCQVSVPKRAIARL